MIAEDEAATVADVLLERLCGGPPAPPFPGKVVCFMEMGDDTIGRVEVTFLASDEPQAVFTPPTQDLVASKRAFGATRRARWFGLAD